MPPQVKNKEREQRSSDGWRQIVIGVAIGVIAGVILGAGATFYSQGLEIAALKEQISQLKSQSVDSASKLTKDRSTDQSKANPDGLVVSGENVIAFQLMQAPSTWGSPISGSSGRVMHYSNLPDEGMFSGKIELKGLKPNHGYMLTLNGNQLPQRRGEESYFDFLQVTTDSFGNVVKDFKVPLSAGEYSVKFFVKNTEDWKVVLYNDLFRFKVK